MAKSIAVTEQCPMEIGLNVLSGKWKLKILWQVSKGAVRFNELQRRLGKITTKTLTQQLRELEEEKILARTVYPDNPPYRQSTIWVSLLQMPQIDTVLPQRRFISGFD